MTSRLRESFGRGRASRVHRRGVIDRCRPWQEVRVLGERLECLRAFATSSAFVSQRAERVLGEIEKKVAVLGADKRVAFFYSDGERICIVWLRLD